MSRLHAALLASLDSPEENAFWRDVNIRLVGALPNEHPKLTDQLELTLGRRTGPDGKTVWRKYVLGLSALFDRFDHRPWPLAMKGMHYSWMDIEGVLLDVEENGDRIKLTVDVWIHPDPWIEGGYARFTIDLVRAGHALTGTYKGSFERTHDGAAGPAGAFAVKGTVAGRIRETTWPGPVAGHVPLKPGEHPRLMFRPGDVPALRRRLETSEGKAMFSRLQSLLAKTTDARKQLWHGYGYGLLYQLTGDRTWADRARKYAEGCVEGTVKASRYGWYTTDGGYMRVGPSVAATAAAYDMCYDAWDDGFRRWLAKKIQDRIYPNLILEPDLRETDGQINQRSNHYLLHQGGAGFAILAILGDPGTDDRVTRHAHRILMRRLKRGLEDGFGDRGWFYEGTFCGRFPTNVALLPYLQALRIAVGKDFVTGSPEASWLTTKWIYEAVRTGGKVDYHPRGMYNKFKWDHFTGDFAQGFGVCPQRHKPAVLWFYQTVIEPSGVRRFDAGGVKQAAYAFVNWPLGLAPLNPADVLGHVMFDREAQFFVFRSGWQGEGDVVVSMRTSAAVLGMGLKTTFVGLPGKSEFIHFEEHDDHTVTLTARGTTTRALAVDFSGVCGAPVLLASVDFEPGRKPTIKQKPTRELPPWLKKTRADKKAATKNHPTERSQKITAAGYEFTIKTLQRGPAPEVEVVGEGGDQRIRIGKRILVFDGKKLVLREQ